MTTDPRAALRARAEQLALAYHKAMDGTGEGEYGCPGVECPGVKRLAEFLLTSYAALVGARPPANLKMRDSVLYAELKDLWSSAHFDPETMPVAIMRDFCRGTREALDAMLKGFEGKSLRQWCDEQWDDGLPQRTEVGARPPAQDEIEARLDGCTECVAEEIGKARARAEAAEAQLQALQQAVQKWQRRYDRGYDPEEEPTTTEYWLGVRAVVDGLASLTQPGAAPRVTFTVRCNYCGHLPCDCTEQPGAAGQE